MRRPHAMPPRPGPRHPTLGFLPLCALLASGCGDDASSSDAGTAGDGGVQNDATPLPDTIPPLGWVDFSVAGCDPSVGADGGVSRCAGEAPLTASFTTLAPGPVIAHQWRFGSGDAGVADVATPEHIFFEPGSYDVQLAIEGPGGTADIHVVDAIEVVAARTSAPCAVDSHCASGSCLCGEDMPCPTVPGFCSALCIDDSGCASGLCADLDATDGGDEAWQDRVCLRDCESGAACPAGTLCQDVLGADGAWRRGCLAPGALSAIGESCDDPVGALDPTRCASGTCLDVGERGLCSFDCGLDPEACPGESTCATFDSGSPTPSCLAPCPANGCQEDPGLSCQAPGTDFDVVASPPDDDGYCAPEPI